MPLLLLVLTLCVLTPLLGHYLTAIFQRRQRWLTFFYRWLGVDPDREMSWQQYVKSLLIFNGMGLLFLFFLQRVQHLLGGNPQHYPPVPWALAFNTAVSFVTNTNWQAYSGESTFSYLTQMAGLTVQNFLSAATGCSVQFALVRGLTRSEGSTIGNFWVDLTRATLCVLLPLAALVSLGIASQGVIQNFNPYLEVVGLEGIQQVIPGGPVATQVAIKQLGSNGGGFFGGNSTHPFENPTPLANFLETLCILLLPAALVYAYGLMIGSRREGCLLLLTMAILWGLGLGISSWAAQRENPALGVTSNFEGQEIRLAGLSGVLWSTSTTATSNGSVNTMLSSQSPLVGGVCLLNMLLGGVIFGGVGVGMCSMLLFILLTLFLAGLLIGRTPEYLGKKIGTQEICWVLIALLLPGGIALIGASCALQLPHVQESLLHGGPHGLTELAYAYASAAANNGSAFAGLNANTDFFNLSLAFIMLGGRLAVLIPSLVLAGLFVQKKRAAPSLGTFPTDHLLFAVLLVAVILLLGALTFFPLLVLGPFVEHLLMLEGRTF